MHNLSKSCYNKRQSGFYLNDSLNDDLESEIKKDSWRCSFMIDKYVGVPWRTINMNLFQNSLNGISMFWRTLKRVNMYNN
jgi:hypothetical protein